MINPVDYSVLGIDCFIGLPREESNRCAVPEDFNLTKAIFDVLKPTKNWVCEREDNPYRNVKKMTKNIAEAEGVAYAEAVSLYNKNFLQRLSKHVEEFESGKLLYSL